MIPRGVRIFVCTEPQDMRRSFDGLSLAVREVLGDDPQNGALFVFVNKRSNRLKCLWWDRTGYCLLYKRLDRARFRLPSSVDVGSSRVSICGTELARILEGVALPPRKQRIRRTKQLPLTASPHRRTTRRRGADG